MDELVRAPNKRESFCNGYSTIVMRGVMSYIQSFNLALLIPSCRTNYSHESVEEGLSKNSCKTIEKREEGIR